MIKTAFVFPGQGSQSVGMLGDVAEAGDTVKTAFAEASDVLGYDLWQLVQEGPADKLSQTEFTQPALLTVSVALWRLALGRGADRPDVVAGHSLGEYSALVAADVIDFRDAVALVQKRGQFMQSSVPLGKGGMAAVLGLDDAEVVSICAAASKDAEIVQAANFNAPGQVVIAGTNAALEQAVAACKEAGAKRAMPLAVSAPFHSQLMKPAADKMAEALAKIEFAEPTIRIIQNVDADYEQDCARIRDNLVKQMYSAVLWTSTMQRMAGDGVTRVVECGPGKVLAGLNRRIDKTLATWSINDLTTLNATVLELWP